MKIKNNSVICFKVYVSKDAFMCIVYNTENEHQKIYEISRETPNTQEYITDTINKIIECFSFKDFMFCGYNNNHYDNAFINMIFVLRKTFTESGVDTDPTLLYFNNLHSYIINGEYDKWKEYKYGNFFKAFDLMTMNFSKKERISLAEIKFSLGCKAMLNAVDMSTLNGVKSALENDLEAINGLLHRSEEKINLRLDIAEEYKFGTLSLDDVSLGRKVLSTIFAQNTGKAIEEYEKPQLPEEIKIEDIILPVINFVTGPLKIKFESLKQKTISIKDPKLEERFCLWGSNLSLGLGGLHSIESSRIVKTDPWRTVVHVDAESMYPTLLSYYEIYPKFLGKEFLEAYRDILGLRLIAKNCGEEEKNSMFKKMLVSMVGAFNNPNDILYDPLSYYKITINSQLILLMVAEYLSIRCNASFLNWNTDGLFIEMNKYNKAQLEGLIGELRTKLKIRFIVKYYQEFYQIDGNDYFCALEDWNKIIKEKDADISKLIVCKGMFKSPSKTLKASNAPVITKAVIANMIFGIDVEKVINETFEKNVKEFLVFYKEPSQFTVYYGNSKVSNTGRYYYSMSGFVLMRKNEETKSISCVSEMGRPVMPMAFINDNIKDIDKKYYINKAKSIIGTLKNVQLTMFK